MAEDRGGKCGSFVDAGERLVDTSIPAVDDKYDSNAIVHARMQLDRADTTKGIRVAALSDHSVELFANDARRVEVSARQEVQHINGDVGQHYE